MMTEEQILKFTSDPDWKQFQDMFEAYIKPLTDISSLDLTQPATSIKAEIRVRKQTHDLIRRFLDQEELRKQIAGSIPASYK